MWTPIQHLFKRIDNNKLDNKANRNHYNNGRSFFILRNGIYRDMHELRKIYLCPWNNNPIVCTKIIPTLTSEDSKIFDMNMGKLNRIKLFSKLGPFDYIEFSPIYSCVVFGDNIEYPLLIHKTEYFDFKSYLDRKKDILADCKWFDDKDLTSLVFIPVTCNYRSATIASTLDITNIQYILCATNYMRLMRNGHFINRGIGYGDIDSVTKLKALLVHNRPYAGVLP